VVSALREYAVSAVLLILLAGFAVHLVMRPMTPRSLTIAADLPSRRVAEADAGPLGVTEAPAVSVTPREAVAPDAGPDAAASRPAGPLGRPLRLVALGWELAAPGIVAEEESGGGLSEPGDLDVQIRVVDDTDAIERALARGGEDDEGADVAVLPLPALVGAADRLRALEPQIILVTGWSRGRESLLAAEEGLLSRGGPSLPEEVTLAARSGSTALFLAAFVLDLGGVSLGGVRMIPPGDEAAAAATFEAVEEPAGPRLPRVRAPRGQVPVLSTTEAASLVPFVAVAPRRLVETEQDALVPLARSWLAGAAEAASDLPTAARRVAAAEGAPEALELLRRLDRTGPADLDDNVHLLALAGRRAATVDTLAARVASLYRELGLLERREGAGAVAVSADVVSALVRAGDLGEDPEGAPVAAGAAPGDTAARLVMTADLSALSEADRAEEVALLAETFVGARLRIVAPAPAARSLVESTRNRHGLAESRLVVEALPPLAGAGITLEVLAP